MVGEISRERLEKAPSEVYSDTILAPGYHFQLGHYFTPIVETNKAWTVMLLDAGIIDDATASGLAGAISDLEAAGPESIAEFDPTYEYFYSHVERYLSDRAGEEVGGEINIGRTRPEPLARLVVRSGLLGVAESLTALREILLDVSDAEAETVMPLCTHMQHAQVATFGHYMVGVARVLERDHTRIMAAFRTTNVSTLGCGALAGSSYPLDRDLVAALLGFDGFRENANDCVASGDWLQEVVAAVANMMIALSRMCQDLYIWHTREHRYMEIGDEFSGSSSMMPQKKNPYPFEYVRGMAARVVGDMSSTFGALHNVNFQDTKDVEEEIVYPGLRVLDEASRALTLLVGTMQTLVVHRDTMAARAMDDYAWATELAAVIHRKTPGLSYRQAHRVVGHLVLKAVQSGLEVSAIDSDLVNEAGRAVLDRELDFTAEDLDSILDPLALVSAHATPGGTAPLEVRRAVQDGRATLASHADELQAVRESLRHAHDQLQARISGLVAVDGDA